MVQVFNALPTPPSGLLKHWQGVPTFYFEIVSVEQTTHFQVVTPRAYREYLISQLMAVYPEMVILEGSECMFPAPAPLTITQLTRLQLARPNYYPLLSLEAFAEDGGDGLSGALSALSQLREGEAALLQLAVSKAHESWKDATLRQLAASHEAPPLNDNFQVLVRHKLGLPSFRFTLHLVVQATDEQRAYDLERQLRESLHIFASPVNYLERSRLWWPHRQLARVLQRQVAPRRQILSSEELAMVYHLPNRSLSTIRNPAWGKRLPGEPPENLPAYAATDRQSERRSTSWRRSNSRTSRTPSACAVRIGAATCTWSAKPVFDNKKVIQVIEEK